MKAWRRLEAGGGGEEMRVTVPGMNIGTAVTLAVATGPEASRPNHVEMERGGEASFVRRRRRWCASERALRLGACASEAGLARGLWP